MSTSNTHILWVWISLSITQGLKVWWFSTAMWPSSGSWKEHAKYFFKSLDQNIDDTKHFCTFLSVSRNYPGFLFIILQMNLRYGILRYFMPQFFWRFSQQFKCKQMPERAIWIICQTTALWAGDRWPASRLQCRIAILESPAISVLSQRCWQIF